MPSMSMFKVLPGMLQRRKGTVLFTGARDSTRGEAGAAESGMFYINEAYIFFFN